MHKYPEEMRELEIRRKLRQMRWVVYECGCRKHNVYIVPYKCGLHDSLVVASGSMFLPEGDPFYMDQRYIC